jgi:hypothetical protein
VEALLLKLMGTRKDMCGVMMQRSFYMLTLTARHHQKESLERVLARVNDAAKRLLAGRMGERWRNLGMELVVKSLEVTYGSNGWHPHLHLVVAFSPLPLGLAMPPESQVLQLMSSMETAWLGMVDAERGPAFKWEPIKANTAGEVAKYVAGISELAKGAAMKSVRHDLKRGRKDNVGAFELPGLLAKAKRGEQVQIGGKPATEQELGNLWREWERAMRGVHQVAIGRGFSELRLTAEQVAERVQELAEREKEQEGGTWQELRQLTGRELWLLRRYGFAPLLEAAAKDGDKGVARVLKRYERRREREKRNRAAGASLTQRQLLAA